MKKIICGLLMCTLSVISFGEENPEIDKSVIEFSEAMGINGVIEATMQQTRDSLKTSMVDFSSNLRVQYPSLSNEQNKVLDEIFNRYVDSIINSIDADKASYIYTSIIAGGMSKNEVEVASNYYTTPEGQNLLKVVGVASTELSQYLLDNITKSAKIAQGQLAKDLAIFKSNISVPLSK